MIRSLTLVLLGLLATPALAGELPPEFGIDAPSGLRARGTIGSPQDADDFAFLAAPGHVVTARVVPTRRSGLVPVVELIGPSAEVLAAEQSDAGADHAFSIETFGIHRIRVRGSEAGPTGGYKLRIRHAPRPLEPFEADEVSGPLSFEITAGPGFVVSLRMRFRGGPIRFTGLIGPDERAVAEAAGAVVERRRSVRMRPYAIPSGNGYGTYRLEFEVEDGETAGRVRYRHEAGPPRVRGRKRRLRLGAAEPIVVFAPRGAVPGERITVETLNAYDAHRPKAPPEIWFGPFRLEDLRDEGGGVLSALVPADLDIFTLPLLVRSATGQFGLWREGVYLSRRPLVQSLSPGRGSSAGGAEVTLRGHALPDLHRAAITVNGLIDRSIEILSATGTEIRFAAPAQPAGTVRFGVGDWPSEITSPTDEPFEYLPVP